MPEGALTSFTVCDAYHYFVGQALLMTSQSINHVPNKRIKKFCGYASPVYTYVRSRLTLALRELRTVKCRQTLTITTTFIARTCLVFFFARIYSISDQLGAAVSSRRNQREVPVCLLAIDVSMYFTFGFSMSPLTTYFISLLHFPYTT